MDWDEDDERWERGELLAEAGSPIRSVCETLIQAVDDTDNLIVDEHLSALWSAVTVWLNTLSELVPDALRQTAERSEADDGCPDAAAPIDISGLFPILWEIDEPDEDQRRQEIEDQRSWLATYRVGRARRELWEAIGDLEDLSFETPTDSSPISGLALRSERLVGLIERWHEVWMLCLHGYYGVHGRYPGVAGEAVEAFEGWLGQMRFDTELRRLLEERDV